jgi:hypothetical protein
MSMGTLVWVCLVAAAVLAGWVIVRFPSKRPKSVSSAIVLLLAGQLAPNVGLLLLPVTLRLSRGPQFAFAAVVLPAFFVLWLTSGWLLLAVGDSRRGLSRRSIE